MLELRNQAPIPCTPTSRRPSRSTRAFNRWIEDQWGFAYKDRIFGVPYLNMSDPGEVVDELSGASTTGPG